MKRITIFGGSKPVEGEASYQEAVQLGKLLASAGYIVQTGGYIGTMEAVSRGAAQVGGHVVGITCDEIEAFRPGKANQWVVEQLHFPTLRQRLHALMEQNDAALALPGGVGTLTEVSNMWNHLLVGAISPRPLILIGTGWKATFECFFQALGQYVPPDQRGWLSFAPDVQSAFSRLQQQFEQG